jgi:hypothetical protein
MLYTESQLRVLRLFLSVSYSIDESTLALPWKRNHVHLIHQFHRWNIWRLLKCYVIRTALPNLFSIKAGSTSSCHCVLERCMINDEWGRSWKAQNINGLRVMQAFQDLTDSMDLNCFWEVSSCAATRELPRIVRKPKVHYHTTKAFQ